MRGRLILIYCLIVLTPLGLLAWLAARVQRSEEDATRLRFESVLAQRLEDVSNTIDGALAEIARALEKETELGASPDPERIRELLRKEPLAKNAFLIEKSGALSYPPAADLSQAERAFLDRTRAIWRGEAVLYRPPEAEASAGPSERRDRLLDLARERPSGWIAWHWEEGLHLLFWRRAEGDRVIGLEVERIALLSRILGSLPAFAVAGRVVLSDSRGDPVFVWGASDLAQGRAVAKQPLRYPLDSLRLEYYPSEEESLAFKKGALALGTALSLVAAAIALIGLAIYFFREQSRQIREAAKRVSFVTQVSHELKTPLTNIRLYAELLEQELELEEDDPKPKEHLTVIVAESQRLARLINNVLTFSKQSGERMVIHKTPVLIDPLIENVLGQFRPALAQRGIAIEQRAEAPAPVAADADALGQILANLFNNVEKYAAAGGLLSVKSAQADHATTVTVSDRGPGIPASERKKVFQPFYRVDDRLSAGVTGTGIGLTIARDLARLHGGELELLPSKEGAVFRLILPEREAPR
jgi:signal transduction histidine kinase